MSEVMGHNLLSYPADGVLQEIGGQLVNEHLVDRATGAERQLASDVVWANTRAVHSVESFVSALGAEQALALNLIGHAKSQVLIVGEWSLADPQGRAALIAAWEASGALDRVDVIRCIGCGTSTGAGAVALAELATDLAAARTRRGSGPIEVWGTVEPCSVYAFSNQAFARADILVKVTVAPVDGAADKARWSRHKRSWFDRLLGHRRVAAAKVREPRTASLGRHLYDWRATATRHRWPVHQVTVDWFATALAEELEASAVPGLLAMPDLEIVAPVTGGFWRMSVLLDGDFARVDVASSRPGLLVRVTPTLALHIARARATPPLPRHQLETAG